MFEVETEHRELLGMPRLDTVAELFHENSKIHVGDRFLAVTADMAQVMTEGYKRYDLAARIALPPPGLVTLDTSVGQAMTSRQSVRGYSGQPISASQLGAVLHHAAGLRPPSRVMRHNPSAGGLFPLEVYAVTLRDGDAIPAGCYHYDIRGHTLEVLPTRRTPWEEAIFLEGVYKTAAVILVISAVFGRSKIKYGERGYRFALLESGHLAQNLVLAATALGLGSCTIGGFVDDVVNQMLDLDGVDEATTYLVAIGALTAPGAGDGPRQG